MSIVACSAAFVAMGMGMPDCGGKAMQQQLDAVQASQQTMTTKLTMMESKVKMMTEESNQTKQLITQLSQVVTAQKDAIDREDAAIKDIQAKLTAPPKKAAPTKKKRK